MRTDARAGMVAAFIASSFRRSYLPSSMIRFLSSVFVAMALFLSPLAMASGAGMAMPHAAAAATASDKHCAGKEVPSEGGDSSLEVSCASSCAAYPQLTPLPAEKQATARARHGIAKPQLLAGIHLEGETPPPRMTPEI